MIAVRVSFFVGLLLVGMAMGQTATIITPSTANCGQNDVTVNSCVTYVQDLLASATCASSCVLHFELGTYYLFVERFAFPVWNAPASAALFNITGAPTNTSASLGPSTVFILSDIANLFVVQPSNYTKAHFAHFAVDMARLPYTYGIATSNNTFTLPAWILANPVFRIDPAQYAWLNHAQAINSYFAAQGRWTGDIDDYMLSGATAGITYSAPLADGSITGTVSFINGFSFASVIGQYVILRHQVYQYQVWTVQGYADLSVQHVDVYATGGMGLVCNRCGNIDLDDLRISPPRGTPAVPPAVAYRPVSITADGIHIVNQRGGSLLRLVNSHVEAQGDDCVNVNTAMAAVTIVAGHTITAVGYGDSFPFQAGDIVNVISGETAEFKQQQAGCRVDAHARTITCLQPWASAAVGDLAYCASCMSQGTVANNYFGRNRARGVLLRGLGFTVQANVFDRNSGPAFFAPIDACVFYEGPTLYNLNFVQNTIVGANAGPGSQYGAVALVPQVRQYSNGVPVPNTCIDSPAQVFINATISSNTFIHDVYYNTPLPTAYIVDSSPVDIVNNNISRYAMPTVGCEFFFRRALHYVNGNTCNNGQCSLCT